MRSRWLWSILRLIFKVQAFPLEESFHANYNPYVIDSQGGNPCQKK
jgi:hypothetical protein